MKPRTKQYFRSLLCCLALTLFFSYASLAQEQSQEQNHNIYLPIVQQNGAITAENMQAQPFITIKGAVEQVVSEHPFDQVIISRATVHVKEVLEGNFNGDHLIIRYEGGTMGEITLRVSHQPVLTAGMQVRAKLYLQVDGEYAIYNVEEDLTISNMDMFASSVPLPYRWSYASLPIPIQINPNNVDIVGTGEASAIRNAMNTWNSYTGSYFEFADAGDSTCTANGTTNANGIFCVVWQDTLSSGTALATTRSWFIKDQLTEIDIIFWGKSAFNTDYIWSTNPIGTNQFDVESVALHELGHALGLDHESCCDAVMNPSIGANQIKRTLRTDDLNGIAAQYTPQFSTSFASSLADVDNFNCQYILLPCKSLLRSVKHVSNNGIVFVSTGNYPETMIINRAMTLSATNGLVTIGQ